MLRSALFRRLAVAWLLWLLLSLGPAAARNVAHEKIAGLDVALWLPASPGPWPVLLFSHGFHGCGGQSSFLTAALAEAGYAVFAPNHKDAACGDIAGWMRRSDEPFGEPQRWSAASYADRAADLRQLLDALATDPRYAGKLDLGRVGLIGHSLGGYTVLGMAGGWPGWKDKRIKAVLALSPYAQPFAVAGTLDGLAGIPVMYQGGTRDTGITPFVTRPGGIYDKTPAPKYLVEFDGAGHFAWTDLNPMFQSDIIAYSRAFLDHALKGAAFPAELTRPHGRVSAVRSAP